MSGGGQQQQSNQVSTVQLPPWVNQAAQQNYAFAQDVANRPLQQYQGQQVANPGPQSQQSWQTAANAGLSSQAPYSAAMGGYLNAMGGAAPQITPGALANTNLSPYMNPYTQSVINTTLPIMQQNLALQQNQNQNQAASAGAFGGSRQGVQQGVTQAQGALNMAQMAQQLNQANFGQAQSAASTDIGNQLQAAMANQNAYLNNQGQGIQAAGGLANIGNMLNNNQMQNFMMQQSAGQDQVTQAQNAINANMNKFNQAWNYPTQQMNTLLASLGMTPYGQSQTTSGQTTTTESASPMQAGLGIMSLLGGIFGMSDREEKTDIKKLGKVGKVPMYAYRYKGDPKSYPKVIGPMAQDIQKVAPEKVVSIAGTKAIAPGAGALALPRISQAHLHPHVRRA